MLYEFVQVAAQLAKLVVLLGLEDHGIRRAVDGYPHELGAESGVDYVQNLLDEGLGRIGCVAGRVDRVE